MKKNIIHVCSLFVYLTFFPLNLFAGQIVHSPILNIETLKSSIFSVSKLGIQVQSNVIAGSDINFNSIKIIHLHQEGNSAFVYCNFNNKQGDKFFGYIPLIRQKNSSIWFNRNNLLVLEKYEGQFKNGEITKANTYAYSDGHQYIGKWKNDKPLGKTQNLLNQKPLQSNSHIGLSSQEFIAGEETSSQELHQSAVTLERVAPQISKVDVVAVKDKVQTEAISDSQMDETEKIDSEAAPPVGKQDGPETKVILPQKLKTIKAMEYASIAVGANIRSDASMTSEVMHTAPPGYPVAVLEKREDWFLVEDFWGRKGWIYASLVNKPGTVIIKVFKGNLRSGPSLNDDVIVKLDHGTIMSVLEKNGEWLKVSDKNELTGWLHLMVVWPVVEKNG